jgi:hypothetical protein
MAQLRASQQAIRAGTLVNQHRIILTAKESQALIVMNQELKSEKHNNQYTIKKLHSTIAQYDELEEQMETEANSVKINLLTHAAWQLRLWFYNND